MRYQTEVLRIPPHSRELTQTTASGWNLAALVLGFPGLRAPFLIKVIAQLALLLFLSVGCASQKYLILRDTPANPLAIPLQLTSSAGPQISSRTAELLRRFALGEQYE